MAKNMPPLPLELQDLILEVLGVNSDSKMLATCSLVCQYWRLRSHRHSFATIRLVQTSVEKLHQIVGNAFSLRAILPFVRHIELGQLSPMPVWNISQLEALAALLSSLSAMGNINTLALANFRWIMVGTEVLSLICSGFMNVTTLKFLGMEFMTPTEFTGFIVQFPHLRHIVIQSIDLPIIPQTDPPLSIPPGSYGLTLTEMDRHSIQKSLRWDRSGVMLPISELELEQLGSSASVQSPDVSALLRVLGTSLHHLELASQTLLPTDILSDDAFHTLDLSHNTSLTQLSVGSSTQVLSLMYWVLFVLCQIPDSSPPTLNTLQIAFASSRQFHLDRPFLRRLADILSKPQFENLETIHFVALNGPVDMGIESIVMGLVQEILADWNQRGILTFTFARSRLNANSGLGWR